MNYHLHKLSNFVDLYRVIRKYIDDHHLAQRAELLLCGCDNLYPVHKQIYLLL